MIPAFIAAAFVYRALQPKADPFEYGTVAFSGTAGSGTAEAVCLTDTEGDVDPHAITCRLSDRNYPSEGDRVTVTAAI